MNDNRIPAQVNDWLNKLYDPNIADNAKDNYYMNLDHLKYVIEKQLEQYRLSKIRQPKRVVSKK